MKKLPAPNSKVTYVPISGGDDTATAPIEVDPGRAIMTRNYEVTTKGKLRLVDGYERFDGHPAPSGASYWLVNFDSGTDEVIVGDIVQSGTSTAFGKVLFVILSSGAWNTGDATGYLILFNVTGTFASGNNLNVSSLTKCISTSVSIERGAPTEILDLSYWLAAIAATRNDIAAVPGSGAICGLAKFPNTYDYNSLYAWRPNAAGNRIEIYRSTSSGWEQCPFGRRLAFTSGGTSYDFISQASGNGYIITGQISGTTARVMGAELTSGTIAGGDAAGILTVYYQVGTFLAEDIDIGASVNQFTVAGNSSEDYIPTSSSQGYYFDSVAYADNLYFCLNAGYVYKMNLRSIPALGHTAHMKRLAYDITVGLAVHKNHLFLFGYSGVVRHSAPGDFENFSALSGASGFYVDDTVTGHINTVSTLFLFTNSNIYALYGSGIDDWDLKLLVSGIGAKRLTCQALNNDGLFSNPLGIMRLSAVQEYGDFKSAVISDDIQPVFDYLFSPGSASQNQTQLYGSLSIKKKNQYRMFFRNNEILTLTILPDGSVGPSRQKYPVQPRFVASLINTSSPTYYRNAGEEELYFGDANGYVYQMDKGLSFDGEPIEAMIKLHFNNLGSPINQKFIRRVFLELDAPTDTYIRVNFNFDYGDSSGESKFYLTENEDGVWDVENWDAFTWDGKTTTSQPIDVNGNCANFSMMLYHSGEWELQEDAGGEVFTGNFDWSFGNARSGLVNTKQHTIHGYTVHYDVRRVLR